LVAASRSTVRILAAATLTPLESAGGLMSISRSVTAAGVPLLIFALGLYELFISKIDHNLNTRWKIFGTYSRDWLDQANDDPFGFEPKLTRAVNNIRNHATISATAVFNPALISGSCGAPKAPSARSMRRGSARPRHATASAQSKHRQTRTHRLGRSDAGLYSQVQGADGPTRAGERGVLEHWSDLH
jgi:hypothetical protein